MISNIRIIPANVSRIDDTDFENLQFGATFSDHMFSMDYREGRWQDPRIEPFGTIEMHPVAVSLHYGQTIFEGMKAYRGVDGEIRVFRPEMNHERMSESCRRMCMPQVERETFIEAIETLVRIDHRWVPHGARQALYVRPVLFATEGHLDVRPATEYKFMIVTSPVGGYFQGESPAVALKVEEHYTRAIKGGTGYAKTGGNYAATFRPTADGREQGFEQVLWLDGEHHAYVEEVGQMNICFHLDGKLVTPSLRGTILPGVTRASVLRLAEDFGIASEERLIHIDEIIEGIGNGKLQEAFGCGTAAVITVIGSLGYKGRRHELSTGNPDALSKRLYEAIVGIQRGEVEDRHGWTRTIKI